MTNEPTLKEQIEARIADLEARHGTAASCGEHDALEYHYDMEVAAALHELKGVVRMLAAALPTEAPQGWRPIETAPKDGTWILLRGESGYVKRPYRAHVGRWVSRVSSENRDGGWWEESEDAYFMDDGDEPTHWMPLPAPPQREQA